MPYKNPGDRRRRYKERRLSDPQWVARYRVYQREYQRRYRAENLKETRTYQKEWARVHRRKVRGEKFGKRRRKKTDEEVHQTLLAKRRRFHHRHRDQINTARKQKRVNNPERFHAIDRARYWRDPEKRRHQSRIARAKRSGKSCYISLQDWQALLVHFNFRCAYCGTKLNKKNRSLDHRTPLVRGGTNEISNLVPSCLRCNQRKHSMTAEEFLRHHR